MLDKTVVMCRAEKMWNFLRKMVTLRGFMGCFKKKIVLVQKHQYFGVKKYGGTTGS